MIQNNTAEHDHRIIETLTSGPGTRPKPLIDRPFYSHNEYDSLRHLFGCQAGMLTVCSHGWVLREGWPGLSPDLTGEELVLLIKEHKPALIHYSALPNHCRECETP